MDTALDLGILLSNTKFGQGSDSSCSDDCVFQNDTVVDVSDVFRRLGSFGALHAQQVQNADSKLGELAVFDELAEVCKSLLFALRDKLDEIEQSLHDTALEVVAALIAKNTRKESQHARLF